jgi:hypothetical protein
MAILFLGHLSPVQSYVWLPLILFFLNRAIIKKKPYSNAAIAGVLWGIQILAGAPQDAFYTLFASLLFLAFSFKKKSFPNKYIKKIFYIALLFFLIGAGTAAIQIIPAFEFIGQSVRGSLDSYAMATERSYPLEGIITTIMPHFFWGLYERFILG